MYYKYNINIITCSLKFHNFLIIHKQIEIRLFYLCTMYILVYTCFRIERAELEI